MHLISILLKEWLWGLLQVEMEALGVFVSATNWKGNYIQT